MYLHALERLKEISMQEICGHQIHLHVVTQYEKIMDYCKKRKIAYTENKMAAEGIAASVRLGVQACMEADWFLFLPADQPGIKKETILSFLENVLGQDKTMASVICEGNPGNPTIFKSCHREELLLLEGDRGGRKIMKVHPRQVYWYPLSKKEIMDIDIPEQIDKK